VQRVESLAPKRRIHGHDHEAAVGIPITVAAAMIAVGSEADMHIQVVWPFRLFQPSSNGRCSDSPTGGSI
jgi:hypothetical protein